MTDLVDEEADYLFEVHDQPAGIDADEWNALLSAQAQPSPFLRHEFLQALHDSGCASADNGWQPVFLAVRHRGELAGAVASYLKSHSWGEYVFDWAWADAYRRHGLSYYPKLVAAVPFTPVPGSRLLARNPRVRRLLLRGLVQVAEQASASSVHLLFPDDDDQAAACAEGWLMREGVQFHWCNRPAAPWRDFADYLTSLQRDKRKKIQQERRRVTDAGVHFEVAQGRAITESQWDHFHHCYTLTYAAHQSTPYLNRDFFRRLALQQPEAWLMFVAHRAGRPMAASLVAVDGNRGVAYGRYWGSTEPLPCLHFEACYYQPLDWCIRQGYTRFEGGAQGEHKMARGLMPVRTASAHWLADARFAHAVEDFLAREGAGVHQWMDDLRERSPFKPGLPADGSPDPST